MRPAHIFPAICLGLLATISLTAQVAGTGIYAFGSFDDRGFDKVNLGNLNTHFEIPVVNKPGRGPAFAYSLVYDGLVWSPVTAATPYWLPDSSWGFRGQLAGALVGYLTYQVTEKGCLIKGNPDAPPYDIRDNFVYSDQFGKSHSFNYSERDACNTTPGSSSGNGASSDGSGLTLQTDWSIKTSTGAVLHVPDATMGSPTSGGNIVDSNGNKVTNNGNGTFTDTTGTTMLTIAGTGSASSPLVFTYPVTAQSNGAKLAALTVYYKTYTIKTAFGCSGITEYSGTADLVDHVILADSSRYIFSYEATPGVSGAVTGRMASIVLPTGGSVSYSRYGGTNSVDCSNGTTPGLDRTTTDGTRRYQRGGTGSATAYTTMAQDEKGNQTLYHFTEDANRNFEATHQQVYQGSLGGTLLKEVVTCYNGASGSCDGQTITPPIIEADATTSYNGGSQDILRHTYDTSGNLLNSAAYSGSTLLAQTANSYNGNSEVLSAKTTDGFGNTVALSTFGYDETTPTATSGLPQHGAGSNIRGNQTSSHVSIDGGTTNMLTTTTAYYDTGMPASATAPGGFTTSYGYDPSQTFTTSTALPTPSSGVALSTGATFDTASGAALSATGFNAIQTTSVKQYDALLRPTIVTPPISGAKTTATYTPTQVTVQSVIDGSRSTNQVTVSDAYGRQNRQAVWNGSAYYIKDACYDATGLLQSVGVPYITATLPPSQSCTTGDSYTYDGLGRQLSVSHADGSKTNWTYLGRAVQQVDSPGTTKIMQYDLLGRQTGVCEISSNGTMLNSGTPGSCGMDIAGTGFVTGYAYNLANHTTTITQGAQPPRILQTDAAGRQILTREPERGQTTFTYTYNGTGLLVVQTRPRANQPANGTATTITSTQFDSIGRPVSVVYGDGTTPTKTFFYDAPTNWAEGNLQYNMKGKLALAYRVTSAGNTGTLYSYDLNGNVIANYECEPSGCGNAARDQAISYGYDLSGNLTSEGDGAGVTYTYGRSVAGEVTGITSSLSDANDPANIVVPGSVQNGPLGPTSYVLGNGLSAVRSYDSSGRNNGNWVCSGSTAFGCGNGSTLYGNYVTYNGPRVTYRDDTVLRQQVTFGYDEFNRLSSMTNSNGGQLLYQYSYDRWGNRLQQSAPQGGVQSQLSVDIMTNRITGNGLSAFTYDPAGNETSDGTYNYTYDADGNMTAVAKAAGGAQVGSYIYDSLNRRVHSLAMGGTFEYAFDQNGKRVSTWTASSGALSEALIYWDGKPIAFRSGGSTHFQHQDWLGTERAGTSASGAVESTVASLPFGDGYATTGIDWDWYHFAGLDHDGESGTEHATFRQMSSTQGRWMSPDPYQGSYDAANPQSLNRYSYVLNNPLSLRDPSGLFCEYYTDDGGDSGNIESWDFSSSTDECASTGGQWSPDGWGSSGGAYIGYGPGGLQGSYPGAGGGSAAASNTPSAGSNGQGGSGQAPNNPPRKTTCYKPGLIGNAVAKALSWLSLDNGGYILGFNGGVAGGNLATDGTRAFVSDTHGNVGMMTTVAGAAGSAIGVSAAGGLSFGASNYTSLSGYAGWSTGATVSGGVGLGGSASLSFNSQGGSSLMTVGAGYGGSVSGGASYSWVTPLCK